MTVSNEKIRFQCIAMGIEKVADPIVEKEGRVYPKPKNDQEDGQRVISSGTMRGIIKNIFKFPNVSAKKTQEEIMPRREYKEASR